MVLEKLKNEHTDFLFETILKLNSISECYKFFEDICTVTEIKAMSQRLQVAKMLTEGAVYTDIMKETGASTATISRVNRCLNYGEGGYETLLSRMGVKRKEKA